VECKYKFSCSRIAGREAVAGEVLWIPDVGECLIEYGGGVEFIRARVCETDKNLTCP